MPAKTKVKPKNYDYVWREGCRFKADPRVIGHALQDLAQRLGRDFDGITAAEVVDEARKPQSPFHAMIPWDDAEAAEAHRRNVARLILRSIRVRVIQHGKPVHVIGYVKVVLDDGPCYVPTTRAGRDAALHAQMVNDAFKGLQGWKARYKALQGIEEVLVLIDQALRHLATIQPPTPNLTP
jgi:hypothetical protein